MQQYHIEAVIDPQGHVLLTPPFPIGEKVDILVRPTAESIEDKDWYELAAREFLKGYTEENAAYDNYPR